MNSDSFFFFFSVWWFTLRGMVSPENKVCGVRAGTCINILINVHSLPLLGGGGAWLTSTYRDLCGGGGGDTLS